MTELRGPRVLHLEDDPLDAELVAAALSEGGLACEVVHVTTRSAYARALELEHFDLILSDYELGEYDGFQARSLAESARPDVPFILVSGALSEDKAVDAIRQGLTDFVLKHRLGRLVPAARRALEERAAQVARAHAEGALRASEWRSQAILDAAGEGIYGLDLGGRTTFINPAAAHMLGFEPNALLGRALHDATHHTRADGSSFPARECPIHATFRAGLVHHAEDDVFWTSDGRSFPVEYTSTPFHDEQGALAGAVVVFKDVSARKRAEAAQRAVYRIAEASATAQDMATFYAEVHQVVRGLMHAENFFIALYDASRDRLTFPYFVDGKDTQPGSVPPGNSLTGHVLRTGRSLLATPEVFGELVRQGVVEQQGATSVDWCGIPLKRDGETFGVLAVQSYRETERITAAEEELLTFVSQQVAAAIERKRAQADMQRQREALYQNEKLAAMGTLLAGVAHELNNPLAVVLGQAGLLKRAVGEGPIVTRAEKIMVAAERCARIVRNFLALAHQRTPERGRIHLNQVIRDVVELVAYPLRVDSIAVELRLDDQVPPVWADAHQVHQVLINLITNAQHALKESPPPRRLVVTSRFHRERGVVVVDTTDSGPGIPPEVRARIFDPFFTTKPAGQGTGLGLALSRGIVEAHGGTMEVISEPGHGATFRIELPLGAEVVRREVAHPVRAAASVSQRDRSILVVDDEPEVADVLCEVLAAHRIDVAADGAAALRCIGQRSYDLVLSDLKMPVLDGPGLYREIELAHPELLGRVVFMTGDSMSRDIQEFLERTGVPTMAKPFDVAEVLGLVDRMVGGTP